MRMSMQGQSSKLMTRDQKTRLTEVVMGFRVRWPFSREKKKGPKSVNIFLGFFFMVNFCLGTGFLGVPFSFFYAGYLASIPTLLLIAFVSWNNAEWEVETMARAQVCCMAGVR